MEHKPDFKCEIPGKPKRVWTEELGKSWRAWNLGSVAVGENIFLKNNSDLIAIDR